MAAAVDPTATRGCSPPALRNLSSREARPRKEAHSSAETSSRCDKTGRREQGDHDRRRGAPTVMQSSCILGGIQSQFVWGRRLDILILNSPPDQEHAFTDVLPGQLRSASPWPNKPGRMPHTTPGIESSLQCSVGTEWWFRTMARRRGHLCTNLVPKRNSFMSCLSHLSHVQTSQRRPLSPDTTSRRPQGVWTSVLPHCVSFRSSAKQRTWWWNIAQTDNKKRRVDTDYSETQSLRRLETVRVTSGAMLVG